MGGKLGEVVDLITSMTEGRGEMIELEIFATVALIWQTRDEWWREWKIINVAGYYWFDLLSLCRVFHTIDFFLAFSITRGLWESSFEGRHTLTIHLCSPITLEIKWHNTHYSKHYIKNLSCIVALYVSKYYRRRLLTSLWNHHRWFTSASTMPTAILELHEQPKMPVDWLLVDCNSNSTWVQITLLVLKHFGVIIYGEVHMTVLNGIYVLYFWYIHRIKVLHPYPLGTTIRYLGVGIKAIVAWI